MASSDPPGSRGPTGDRLSAAAGRAARDRDRLRTAEAQVSSEVIEFQLARQRGGFRSLESVEPLTPRELEELGPLAAGRSDAEIADELFVSKKTASVHVANIKAKLGASSRVEIALMATRLGLVDPSSQASPAQTGAADTRTGVICPFKGLASFEVWDAPFFFGRERTIAELVARLAGSTFLGVVGASGSGKSSVVRAGLVPALADGVLPGSELWTVAIFRPGRTPQAELDRALKATLRSGGGGSGDASTGDLLEVLPAGSRLVLVVDQFEELFTVCSDEAERAAFIRAVVSLARDPASRVLVVIAVRADFYGRCADERELAELLGANHVLVGPLAADELARAIELPGRAAQLRVEPELVSALVNDVLDQPGGLPLLSTTLLDLWERRDGRSLRLATYEGIGGLAGAVSRLAERALARLTEEQLPIARSIFLRLAGQRDESDVVVRRPVPMAELGADRDPAVAHVLQVLTESRLLTVSEGLVEVAHEALLREWPRLRAWLEEDAEGRRVRAHLTRAARDWERAGDDPAELYRGARLAAAIDWSQDRDLELNELERRFLEESRGAGEREADRQRRVNRRLRVLLGVAVAFLAVALVAGAFGALQLGRAEKEATSADQARQLARSRELAASAVAALGEDPALSKLLALAAASSVDAPPPSVAAVLHEALANDRIVRRYEWPTERSTGAWTDLHPTDDLVVAAPGLFEAGVLEVLDATGRRVWSFEPPPGATIGRAFFTPDGDRVVAGVYRHPDAETEPAADALGAYVWDARSGAEQVRVAFGSCGAVVTAVSDDEAVVRTASERGCLDPGSDDPRAPIGILDLATRAHRVISATAALGEERAALTRDGRYLAYDDLADPPRSIVHDLQEGTTVLEVDLTAPQQQDHSFVRGLSDDGSLLLYGDIPVQVREVASGEVVASFGGQAGATFFAEFAPDGTVLSTGRDAAFRRWDPRTGRPSLVVPAVGSGRPSASAAQRVLVSSAATRSAVVLDVGVRGEIGAVDARAQGRYWEGAGAAGACFVSGGSLRAGGDHLLFLDGCSGVLAETTTQAVPVDGSALRYSLPGASGQTLAISPDGTRFARQEASGQEVGPIAIRDLATGDLVLQLEGTCRYENSFESAEGVGECASFPEQPFPVWAYQLRWSPDGSMVAAVDQANGFFVAVWDTTDGSLITRQRLAAEELAAADVIFTPDSGRLIVAHYGGTVQAFSTDTWGPLTTVKLDAADGIAFFGFSPDGSTLHVLSGYQGAGGGALHWLDAGTLRAARPPRERIHEGSPKSIAMSDDGSLVATGASDGLIRVWDAASGDLRHELSFGDTEIQGVAFVAPDHLAVATRVEGSVLHLTLDVDTLIGIARESLTRTFTEFECSRYGIEPCPTLEQLRAG